MAEKVKLICETCLSSDRRLIATSRIISIVKEIQCEELSHKLICWECHSVILKFHKFKIQAKNAEIALLEKNFKNLSKLSYSTKQKYDYDFVHIYKDDFKTKIKYEDYDSLEDFPTTYHSVGDDKKLTITDLSKSIDTKEILPETNDLFLKQTSKKSIRKQSLSKRKLLDENLPNSSLLHNKKETDASVLKKFETVILSEEEMLKSREEKRNHPNFKKIPYKCDTCVLGFTKKDNYDGHIMKKHTEDIGCHICDVCCTRFESASSLTRHRTCHYTRYSCLLCKYKPTSMTAAVTHVVRKHATDERDRIHCKQCPAVFRTSGELSEHARLEHILYCEDCGETFKGQHTLRAHRVRIHAVKREFVCGVCKRCFLTKSRLESHMARHSPTLARQLAYCGTCNVQYKNIQVYRSHLQNNVNHAQNRYQCPDCNKKFASKIYRTKHYNFYHLKKSQYKCETCKKLFISEWRLKNHRQKHHGLPRSRNHECKDCEKKFYTVSALSVHLATHSVARRHLCALCGAQYRQPAALYTHQRRAHSKQTR